MQASEDHDKGSRPRGKIVARLDWEDQAAEVRWSIEQGKKKRRPPTDDQTRFLSSKPDLDHGGFLIASAYAQLSTCRQISMGGIGPIPITAVWQWEDRNGVTDRAIRAHFEAVITGIDASTMKRANRPTQASGGTIKEPQKPKAAKPPQRRRIAK